jgi:hypothetical protein
MPNQCGGDLLHTMAGFELSRVRTELQKLLVVPFLAQHPIQTNGSSACHRYLSDPAFSPHRQMDVLPSPVWVVPNCDLRCLHQQET